MNKKILKILCALTIVSLTTSSAFAAKNKEIFKTKNTENVKNKKSKVNKNSKKYLNDNDVDYNSDSEEDSNDKKNFSEKTNKKEYKEDLNFKDMKNNQQIVDGKNIEINNYKSEIIKKEGITFIVYEHIKSGAKIVICLKKDKDIMDISSVLGTHFYITPKDNRGNINIISQMLNNSIVKDLRKNYNTTTLANNGRLRGLLFPVVDTSYNALGFNVEIQTWTPKMVQVVANNLKNPKFMDDNEESLKIAKDTAKFNFLYSKRDWNNKKWKGKHETSEFFSERLVGGLYKNSGKMEEIDSLNINEVKDFYLKNVVPANSITIISEALNPNYKEILELMDKEYLQYFNKNDVVFEKNDVNKLTKTEPIRKLGVDSIRYTTYDDPKRETYRHTNMDAKSVVKLTWSTENFSIQEQDVFRFNFPELREFVENIAKEKGYLFAEISYDAQDKLFSIELYRKEGNDFEENKIREDSKQILEKIYEKIKDANYEKLKELYTSSMIPDNVLELSIRSYRNDCILYLIYKSFEETRNPFSEKFFEIKNNVILDDVGNKKFLENVKNHKDAFERLINTPAKYIDFAYEKEQKEEIPKYPDESRCSLDVAINVKYDILRNIVSELVMNKFLIPNINGKNHVPIERISCMPAYNKKEFLKIEIDAFKVVENEKFIKEIKDYLTKELPEGLKNYIPTQEELNKEKEKLTFSIKEDLEYRKRLAEKDRRILNNDKKIRELALVKKETNEEQIKTLKSSIQRHNEKLKDANISEEEKKNVEEQIKSYEKQQKEFESKISLEYCTEEVKKQMLDSLNEHDKKVKEIEEDLKSVENITLDDLNNAIKSIKIPVEILTK